ncbi:MAG: bacillithiol system redox-active protein YtxJ [Gemmatimonadetes bacterium]|nr:bacillithiol system redox-active protein YtxJ [Gemmatimonadota bacterium]
MLQPVENREELERILEAPLALIYKHSTICGLSSKAIREVESFVGRHPDVPVYIIDVLRNRAITMEVQDRLGVRHKSPQVIVVANGEAKWHKSHWGIKSKVLSRQIAALKN